MIDKSSIELALEEYKQDFVPVLWESERYKWEAIKVFQDNWDVNATDFADMLERSFSGTYNLLLSASNFPAKMIVSFARSAPDDVRAMFVALFDESVDVIERIETFKEKASVLHEKYGNGARQHYQNENSISIYLWLRYPDKYYIFKLREIKNVATKLLSDYRFIQGHYEENLRNFYSLYDEICEYVSADKELINLFESQLTEDCYPDPKYKTLTVDVGFYISRYYLEEELAEALDNMDLSNVELYTKAEAEEENPDRRYWWLDANPRIWSFSKINVGERQSYSLRNENNNKRRIYQNFLDVKVGDMVIGYESQPVKQIVAICRITAEQNGEKIEFEKVENLTSPIDYATLKACPELEKMEFLVNPNGSLFKLTEDEYDFIMDLIRAENPIVKEKDVKKYSKEKFLNDVFMDEKKYDTLVAVLRNKKNIILQGAPGVGKTYAARRLAYSIMGEEDEERVQLVQFHQNYSYEDFIMGYKPTEDGGFELRSGVFYRFCQKASNLPDKDFFFIIDEINRGNMSKIFGELLMLIEKDYRGERMTLPYEGKSIQVPKNLYIIGMMNTADRSLAMIDYALRRRFSFIEMEPAFDSEGFRKYQESLNNETFDRLIDEVIELNKKIAEDKSLGKGFCIGHSYFCNWDECTKEKMQEVVDFDIIPTLEEYWFDEPDEVQKWSDILHGVVQ